MNWLQWFACLCSDLRARLELAIERALELVQQVEQQKAATPGGDRRSSVCDEVQYTQLLLLLLLVLLCFDRPTFLHLFNVILVARNGNSWRLLQPNVCAGFPDSFPVASEHWIWVTVDYSCAVVMCSCQLMRWVLNLVHDTDEVQLLYIPVHTGERWSASCCCVNCEGQLMWSLCLAWSLVLILSLSMANVPVWTQGSNVMCSDSFVDSSTT